VHDPEALNVARHHFGDSVEYSLNNYDCLRGADALIILTEWKLYRHPDLERVHSLLAKPIIFDGRNLFSPVRLRELGFEYSSIGRPVVSDPVPV
jgi:UDPglucose 6-dehydrogenase